MPKSHRFPDETPRQPTEGAKAPPLPLFIRRLGALSGQTAALFESVEEAVGPLIDDGHKGHRVKKPDEMYIVVADASWISQASQRLHISPTKLRANLNGRLPSTAHHPQQAHLTAVPVQRAGRDGSNPVGQSPGGFTRLELLVDGPEVMADWKVGRSWAVNKGLRVPQIGWLAMNLLAPTDVLYSRHVLATAANEVQQIMVPGTVLPFGPVVPYFDFFDASGHLLPRPPRP